MEQNQHSTRKLVALTAAILVCAGVPHFLMERHGSAPQGEGGLGRVSPKALFPAAIGGFHAIDQEVKLLRNGAVDYVTTYSDPGKEQTAQFALFRNTPPHSGAACYLTSGMHMREQHVEKLQTADSSAAFQISSFEDESRRPGTGSPVLIASTVCSSAVCTDSALSIPNGWARFALVGANSAADHKDQRPVSLSILFQSNDGASDQETLTQFRELMSTVSVGDLRKTLFRNQ